MQIVVIVLSVKFLRISHNSNYWFQIKSTAYSVKMSSFDTLHGHTGSVVLARQKPAAIIIQVHLSYKRLLFDTTVDLTTRN